ncbi:hypothetical protein HA402_014962 [Bradysia odoriphaga]|nr:hypothetical protein HA402_014962 [Bradysia odoriphaga]
MTKTVRVKNFISQKQLPDTLHLTANRSACPGTVCLGSLMQNSGSRKDNTRTNTEIFSQAVKFIEEYYMQQKKTVDEVDIRLDEISQELSATGTYTLTSKELEFGARTAWRNASRCIGRIQWQNLNLFDARHVRTTRDMFEAVCKHIEFATNQGNIRSCITVFPQRVAGRDDFRLWNPQLISYAGYLQPDGSIIGDPFRVPLTRICERLGWKGKGGRFDVLPLIFSAPGECAKFYELPKHIILEVEIEHPKYDWLAEMNLRWYALPAVSDMLFDVGGIEFCAAPFNGWYMGTEIGARNFCDKYRYNLLPEFGEKMGLSVDDPTSLWKDEALLEVNKAVVYSFAKNRVTLVDHHTASQQFMQHMQNETKKRGGCPADWVWIVPPMSGSATECYHQEMVNYHLKPSFEYQEPAWRHYEWKKVEIKTKLSVVARTVRTCVRIMRAIIANRVKATILFATETGRSEIFAEKICQKLSSSLNVELICMDNYDINQLPEERLLFVVASTFGNGDPPDNGKSFWKSLCNIQKTRSDFDLNKLMFSVFGLGSSLYPKFNAFAKNIDKKLRELNAKSLKPITTSDEMRGQEKLFSVWCDVVCSKALNVFGVIETGDDNDDEIVIDDTESFGTEVFDGSRYRVIVLDNVKSVKEQKYQSGLAAVHSDRRYPPLLPMKVVSRNYLQPIDNKFDKQSMLVRLQPMNLAQQLSYQPGDHLGVFPRNSPDVVDALMQHLRETQLVNPQYLESAVLEVQHTKDNINWTSQNRLPPITLHEALTCYLDITSTPGPRFLASMSMMATDEDEKTRLNQLAQAPEEYKKWIMSNYPSLLDVLLEFPSVRITPEFLLSRQPLLAPRLYSISSSLRAHPNEVQLTMSLVQFSAQKGPAGAKKFGVCTSFFDRLPEHQVHSFVRPCASFRLPDDSSVPIILIGAGSGIAPFRSFWQEREAIANESGNSSLGKCILFFGCRSRDIDYLYEEEHTKLLERGILHNVFVALSREDRRIYVQDEVFEQRSLVFDLLERQGAHVYVCGDAAMADGVRKSLQKVYTSAASYNESEAENVVDDLFNENRYHEDVFGALHSF